MCMKKQYMRDSKRNKIGVMVAIKDGDHVYLGFSKCNTKVDKFNKTIGTDMALGRARKYFDTSLDQIYSLMPESVVSQIQEFLQTTMTRNPDHKFPLWACQLHVGIDV